jgi:enoyl-CoA hydratase/carnithine racemase
MAADFAEADAFQTILCDTPREAVARITLNRPGVMNAYTDRMCEELNEAIARFRDDDGLRALVLTGAGGRAFCTGGDLSGGGGEAAEGRRVATQPMGHGRQMREGMQAVVLPWRAGSRWPWPAISASRRRAPSSATPPARRACCQTRAALGSSPAPWASTARSR